MTLESPARFCAIGCRRRRETRHVREGANSTGVRMPADPSSPASNGTTTETSAPRTAIIIPFPDARARQREPNRLADMLVRAAATLSESAEQLHRQSRDLDAWRSGFDQAKEQLAAESDRAQGRIVEDHVRRHALG